MVHAVNTQDRQRDETGYRDALHLEISVHKETFNSPLGVCFLGISPVSAMEIKSQEQMLLPHSRPP